MTGSKNPNQFTASVGRKKKNNTDFLFYQNVKKNVFVQSIYKQNMTFNIGD